MTYSFDNDNKGDIKWHNAATTLTAVAFDGTDCCEEDDDSSRNIPSEGVSQATLLAATVVEMSMDEMAGNAKNSLLGGYPFPAQYKISGCVAKGMGMITATKRSTAGLCFTDGDVSREKQSDRRFEG